MPCPPASSGPAQLQAGLHPVAGRQVSLAKGVKAILARAVNVAFQKQNLLFVSRTVRVRYAKRWSRNERCGSPSALIARCVRSGGHPTQDHAVSLVQVVVTCRLDDFQMKLGIGLTIAAHVTLGQRALHFAAGAQTAQQWTAAAKPRSSEWRERLPDRRFLPRRENKQIFWISGG